MSAQKEIINKLRLVVINQPIRSFHIIRPVCNLRKPLETSEPIHCYRNIYPWKSRSEFANCIVSSIVYNKHGIIAINKPFGVGITTKRIEENNEESVKNVKGTALFANQKECQYTIEEVLPDIKSALGLSHLSIMKSTERYTSGLVLMSMQEKTSAKIKKSLNFARNQKIPYLLNSVVTVGYPVELTKKETVGVQRNPREDVEGKMTEIVTKMSRTEVKRGTTKSVNVEYRTLSLNKNLSCSLMEISTTTLNFHFIRVYASTRAACILGDPMHGSRMKSVFGIPVKLNSQNATAFSVQKLSRDICRRLEIPLGEKGSSMVPSMIHLRTITLPNFINKQEDLYISAPLPHHFLWTCKQLELEV